MNFSKRTRLKPRIPTQLLMQLRQRMTEIGLHADHFLHMGELTWLFTHRGWVMVAKPDNSRTPVYPPDKELMSVVSELGDW